MTTPEVAKAPALFLRNATGLVKGWSAFDAFGYSFFSVNLVTLGMFYSLAVFAFVPDGSVLSALVLSGVTMTFLCIVYAGLIAVMPRAGGDYVWQTRIFDGVPGAIVAARRRRAHRLPRRATRSALATRSRSSPASPASSIGAGPRHASGAGSASSCPRTGWWFILALWAPIYGYILNIEVLQPLAAIAGATDCSPSSGRRPGRSPSRSSRSSSPRARSPWAWPATPGSSGWSIYIGLIAPGRRCSSS